MKKILILAIDQGTSSSRVLVFDHSGFCRAIASRPLRQHYPKPGWVEQNPEEIWQTVFISIQEVLEKIKGPYSIAAIGITNQRETTLFWETKTGKALGPAIVWQCRRSAAICEELRKSFGDDFFHQKTGLVVDPYFSATKILWRFRHEPHLKRRAQNGEILFGTVDSWILWKLTGGKTHSTDLTNASRTLLLNLRKGQWDDEILTALKIPHQMLPCIQDSIDHFGVTAQIGKLPSGIPMMGIAGDQQAALFGQACFEPGMIKNTYGTGCFILWSLGKKFVLSKKGLITTAACFGKNRMGYALEGSVFIGGAVIQWLRDELKALKDSKDSSRLAQSLRSNEGVYLVPAFTGLGSPYWDPHARGAIFGLTRSTSQTHIVRAALEGIAYQVKDVLEVMSKEVHIPIKELRVDGGASKNNFLMQFQADILRAGVSRPREIETTGQGVAWMAGLGIGFWENEQELCSLRKKDRSFLPKMKNVEIKKLYQGWCMAVQKVLVSN